MRKLRLSSRNLRKPFNVVNFRRGFTYLRDHCFKQQKEDLLVITEKNSQPNQILMERVLGDRVYNLIKRVSKSPKPFLY